MSRRYHGGGRYQSNYNPDMAKALEHIEAYRELERRLGPIVADVKKDFFSLPADLLRQLLADYRQRYGHKAADYAADTMERWKGGGVKMSGQTAQRLLDLVPKYLSVARRYEIIKKLCIHHTKRFHHVINVNRSKPQEAIEEVNRLVANVRQTRVLKELPDHVLESVKWLGDADVVVARSILASVESELHADVERQIDGKLSSMMALINDKSVKAFTQTFEFPNGVIEIQLKNDGCFIASAVYGDPWHEDVCIFREFRDEVLLQIFAGRVLVWIYYAISPSLVGPIRRSEITANAIRTLLTWIALNLRGRKNRIIG